MSEIIKKLNVKGMSCSHCVRAIKEALYDVDGVSKAEVDLEQKTVTVTYDDSLITEIKIANEIEEAGYQVVQSD